MYVVMDWVLSEISQKMKFIRKELSFSFSDLFAHFSKYDNIDFKKSSIMSKFLTTNVKKSHAHLALKTHIFLAIPKTRKSGFGYNTTRPITLKKC